MRLRSLEVAPSAHGHSAIKRADWHTCRRRSRRDRAMAGPVAPRRVSGRDHPHGRAAGDRVRRASFRADRSAEPTWGLVGVSRVHRARVQRPNRTVGRVDGRLAWPRKQAVEPELKLGERFRAIVGVQRLLGFPLTHQNEPAGISQRCGEDVAPAARLAASPTAKTLEQRPELSSPSADSEHLGDNDHGHDGQLCIRASAATAQLVGRWRSATSPRRGGSGLR